MGVGSAKRVTAVRWTTARQMVFAWLLTIPASGATSAFTYYLFKWLLCS
jgi:PiT family inorganic phosphate transporter